jgi:hypothetical protein
MNQYYYDVPVLRLSLVNDIRRIRKNGLFENSPNTKNGLFEKLVAIEDILNDSLKQTILILKKCYISGTFTVRGCVGVG